MGDGGGLLGFVGFFGGGGGSGFFGVGGLLPADEVAQVEEEETTGEKSKVFFHKAPANSCQLSVVCRLTTWLKNIN